MSKKTGMFSQERTESSVTLAVVFTTIILILGGLAEILPLFFQKSTTEPIEGVKPYTALQQAGRDIYVREGCYGCHSQMIRPLRAETLRYGHYSVAGESVYDHPFQWGSKRTGPDLARQGGRNTNEWHVKHLTDPRSVVPESNMPAYPWLNTNKLDGQQVTKNLVALRRVGVPYDEAQIANAAKEVEGKTEMDALIAYLQSLGLAFQNK